MVLFGTRDQFHGGQFFHGCRGDVFGMIQANYIYCAFNFYYYYISSTSDHQTLDPRGWERSGDRIHPFRVYNSVAFNVFSRLCSLHQNIINIQNVTNSRTLLTSFKEIPHPLIIACSPPLPPPPPPAPVNY